uniref:Uncharacterized protein n=1 Tax=Nothobranchius furzeri TaxID=105023 RepID=A0A8C6LBB3_NOTFU
SLFRFPHPTPINPCVSSSVIVKFCHAAPKGVCPPQSLCNAHGPPQHSSFSSQLILFKKQNLRPVFTFNLNIVACRSSAVTPRVIMTPLSYAPRRNIYL